LTSDGLITPLIESLNNLLDAPDYYRQFETKNIKLPWKITKLHVITLPLLQRVEKLKKQETSQFNTYKPVMHVI